MNRYQRAVQIWALLVVAATERKTYTYGQLAKLFGYDGAGTMGQFLAPIMFYCQQHKVPPLTVLVVNQDTELPGHGFEKGSHLDLNGLRRTVYMHNWFAVPFPSETDFEKAS
jgi:hypothetical protein